VVDQQQGEEGGVKRATKIFVIVPLLSSLLAVNTIAAEPTIASRYYPSWTNELSWAGHQLYTRPYGAGAWLEENYRPWWQTRTAHPIDDYSGELLPVGRARLDIALEAGLTMHQPKKSWNVETSPSKNDYTWAFTRGSTFQEPQTSRGYQFAYLNLGMRPIEHLSFDIGAELVGNDDFRYWFPVNDERRLHKDERFARIARGEVKYDNDTFMIRGFTGEAVYGWWGENDLFQLLPVQYDMEYYRRISGEVFPTGGEARLRTDFGTLSVLGGSQIRWAHGPSAFAKYDFPTWGTWENSVVYRNEEIPWDLKAEHERRWAMSYNTSYGLSERTSLHGGVMYQPFRLDEAYQEVDSATSIQNKTTKRKDAMGLTLRGEMTPDRWLDRAGLGYTYLGPVAGNKHQLDADAARTVMANWTLSSAYMYRKPVVEAVPFFYEGTAANPGALISNPRGPDDPFHVWWDNREAHLGSLTLLFDPTPETPFYKNQRNILEEWNISPQEDATWSGALQYRVSYYPTNTDRLYYYEEDRTLKWDPVYHTGALATEHPFSSAVAMLRWQKDRWRVVTELAGGEALAGNAIAYTSQTNFYKPTTVFFSGGLTVEYRPVKMFVRYGKDVWGPADYHTSFGWAYHRVYQAGISAQFWKDFEAGFRYVGTRMKEQFIGADTGAFNEYRGYLTYHFSFQKDLTKQIKSVGRPLPKSIPESSIRASVPRIYPAGGSPRVVEFLPKASADAGVLSWRVLVRNEAGELVRKWEGRGTPPESLQWEGLAPNGLPLPGGVYKAVLEFADLYGNEVTSPAATVAVMAEEKPKSYTLTETAEGLKVTLSSLVLFDVDKYDLKPQARQALEQVGELLKAYPTNKLRISGHTDSSGSDAYNQRLSERRAQTVAETLRSQFDILPSRLTAVGYGESKPVASNDTAEGRQQNRRVEIDILK